MKTFGKYARERIKALGKNQKTLAEELGVSPAYVSQILSGKKNPPDLGRPKNRSQLRVWSECLKAEEEEILDLVRFELHRFPLRPDARFRRMRSLLIRYLDAQDKSLIDEIRSMELHPAEGRAINALVRIYLALEEKLNGGDISVVDPFEEVCCRASADRSFVEEILVGFFEDNAFTWNWDPLDNDVQLVSGSADITEAMARMAADRSETAGVRYSPGVPVVGYVSAEEGFDYAERERNAGRKREYVPLAPGVNPDLGRVLYCVRIRGDSLSELFGDGALLFVKPDSWQEIKDGDLVIFKDAARGKGFAKKLAFAGDNLILKSKNPLHKDIVLHRSDMIRLERVISVVF